MALAWLESAGQRGRRAGGRLWRQRRSGVVARAAVEALEGRRLLSNGPPVFTPGPDVSVNENSGAQTIAGWASGIGVGAGNDPSQTLTFSVTGVTPPVSALQTQWSGYAGGPQHEAISSVASQPLDAIRWSTPVDLDPQYSGNDLYIHYGTPLITQANTVIVPVKTGAYDGFEVEAFNGADGSFIWSQASDYTLPPHDWTPSYSPALVGNRIYFAGAGGTIYYRDSVDSATPTSSGQIAFYGLSNYEANPSAYNSSIHISTPITADAAGDIYFGFQADGSNPLGITDGFARIAPDGSATYTSVATATAGAFNHALTNAAPAVSLNGQDIYVVVSSGLGFGEGDLLELNSTTLAPQASVALIDPSSGQYAYLPDDGTASPMVGPDGDVYFGVLENPFPANHDRGWMLHFSGDLSQEKTPGAFGWDDTASVVPASMVPSYHGTSSYLIMTKYNNYAGVGGNGINKIAILDPNATETDPITGATVMNEVLTIAGVTPDPEFPNDPGAVREWCINTAVVDPATDSILVNSEDGYLYRWDLATNTFTQSIKLTSGVGEAYTPTLIGADGTVYAINNATLYAVGYSQQDLNTGLFSVLPSVDPTTGNLTFTPAPNAFGTSQVTVALQDSGGTTTDTFSITVQNVNQPPTLNAIANPAALPVSSGQQTIALGGITAGPPDELTQSLTVTAMSNNTALIPNPTVNYTSSNLTGILTYTPVAGATGSAVISVTVQNSGGTANGGVNSFTRMFTVTVVPLTSHVNSLSQTQSAKTFAVTASGVAGANISYDLYVSTNGGAFVYWTTVPSSDPTANFTGASSTTYAFHSVAQDTSGDIETKSANLIEASTYVVDLDPPVTSVTSAVPNSGGLFTIQFSGTDPGNSGIASFYVYVKVDGGAAQLVAQVPGGTGVNSVYSGTTTYQAPADGVQHTYAFWTDGVDGSPQANREADPATPDVTTSFTLAQTTPLAITGFSVEKGLVERSFIRYVDVTFNQAVSSLTLNTSTITLQQWSLDGTTLLGTVNLTGVLSASGNVLGLNFGASGLGGAPTTNAADGYYKLIFTNINGSGFSAQKDFYRLLGDVNGDGTVNAADLAAVSSAIGQTGSLLNDDVDGNGTINTMDKTLVEKELGRSLGAGLHLDD